MNQNKQVLLHEPGLIAYQDAWDMQEKLFAETVALKLSNRDKIEHERKLSPNHLIICQHPHVYTLGKSGKQENLLINDEQLNEKGASYFKINRGGDITYHGPGQLVVYPIFDLENFFTDIHKYMRSLEESIIQTLAEFKIQGIRIQGLTGVWLKANSDRFLGDRKICAMGVKASRWVTMHGLALNVNTDLSYFKNIVPCGIDDKAVTSMHQETGQVLDIAQVAEVLKKTLANQFEFSYIN